MGIVDERGAKQQAFGKLEKKREEVLYGEGSTPPPCHGTWVLKRTEFTNATLANLKWRTTSLRNATRGPRQDVKACSQCAGVKFRPCSFGASLSIAFRFLSLWSFYFIFIFDPLFGAHPPSPTPIASA